MVEDWKIEEKKRQASMMFGIPMAICIVLAVVAIGAAIFFNILNVVIMIIVVVCVLASFVLAFLLFSSRSKYDRLMDMRR